MRKISDACAERRVGGDPAPDRLPDGGVVSQRYVGGHGALDPESQDIGLLSLYRPVGVQSQDRLIGFQRRGQLALLLVGHPEQSMGFNMARFQGDRAPTVRERFANAALGQLVGRSGYETGRRRFHNHRQGVSALTGQGSACGRIQLGPTA